jgi:hypothetical protein
MNVFRSRKRPDYDAAAYAADAARMDELARRSRLVDYKSFAAPDGETVTISVWESAEAAGPGAAMANIWPRRAAGGATIMPNTRCMCAKRRRCGAFPEGLLARFVSSFAALRVWASCRGVQSSKPGPRA